MTLHNWLGSVRQRFIGSIIRKPRRRRMTKRGLKCEALESRQLMAGDFGQMYLPGDDPLVGDVVSGDFNGDGHADLAVGLPYEDVGEHREAGSSLKVSLILGSATRQLGIGTEGEMRTFEARKVSAGKYEFSPNRQMTATVTENEEYNTATVYFTLSKDNSKITYYTFVRPKEQGAVHVLYGVPGGNRKWRWPHR